MDPKTVQGMMIPADQLPRISEKESLGSAVQALELCKKNHLSGKTPASILLVHDEQGRIVGKISPIDLLLALEPQYLKLRASVDEHSLGVSYEKMLHSALEHASYWSLPFKDMCAKARDLQIKNFVRHTTQSQIISITDSIDKAIHRFVLGKHDSIFVMDGKKLAGILLFF